MSQPERSLSSYKVIIFDIMGTIVDDKESIYRALKGSPLPIPASWSREDLLTAYGSVQSDVFAQNPSMVWSEGMMEAYRTLDKRLRAHVDASDDAQSVSDTVGGADDDHAIAFARTAARFPLFPDSAAALRALAARYTLTSLTNCDHASLALGPLFSDTPTPSDNFSWVMTTEDSGFRKPSLEAFHFALKTIEERTGYGKPDVLVVAQGLCTDHVPANQLGLGNVFIDRYGERRGKKGSNKGPLCMWTFDDLEGLVQAVEQEGHK